MTGTSTRKDSLIRVCAALVVTSLALLTGCAKFHTERGVESRWRAPDTPAFVAGKTTQADVLDALGPPSQIISLNDGSVFYYLREKGDGAGLILLVYNQVKYGVGYDRAVFFFDPKGVLTEHAFSKEETEAKASKE
jgi:hypothetical protein